MLELSLYIITFFFLAFGIYLVILKKPQSSYSLQKELRPTYSVLTVKNKEDSIEGIVRSIAWQIMTNSDALKELIILDLDSQDQTFFILKKLAKEYPFIHPMHKADYIDFINNM